MSNDKDISMSIKMFNKCFPDIEKLARGKKCDETQIETVIDFINERYDCADFRMVCILRSLYSYENLLSEEIKQKMKVCVLSFKYWMDEPGEDGMCYWSENHQLLFAACEYLAGQLYPKDIFSNNGFSGEKHLQKAKVKIERWLKYRFTYGFTEWHSNTYYEEDAAPLSLLIDFCEDNTIALRSKMLMDLLLLDLALHSFDGAFCASSGRCYEEQKKNPAKQDVLDMIEKAFEAGRIKEYDYSRLSADFILNKKYVLPSVIKSIAQCKDALEIKDSLGLALNDIRTEFADSIEVEDYGLYMWAMEAFTNTQSVNASMKLFNRYKLHNNVFLKDLQSINIPILRHLGLLPTLVRILNPVTQGIAIQRANCLTYKTPYYMLSTAQGYHPQEFGDQQHIWQATLPCDITVFTTHPGAAFFEDNARNFSPSYWVGNGINPHSAQHKNISMSLYDLNVRKGFLEKKRLEFTHIYFPFEKFDEVICVSDFLYCARKNESYIAIFSAYAMQRAADDELIQNGKVTGWAAMLGSAAENKSFEAFVGLAGKCRLEISHKCLTFTGNDVLRIVLKRGFYVNDKEIDTNYPRLESAFCCVPRSPEEYKIAYGNEVLWINHDKLIRKF